MADCCDVDIKIEVCSEDKAKALYDYMKGLVASDRTSYFPLEGNDVGVLDAALSILGKEVNLTGYVNWGLRKDSVVAFLSNIKRAVDLADVKIIINYDLDSEETPVFGQYRFIDGSLFDVSLSPAELRQIRDDIAASTDDEELRADRYIQAVCTRRDNKRSSSNPIWKVVRSRSYCQEGDRYTIESRVPGDTQGDMGLWAEVLRLDEMNHKKDKLMDRIMAVLEDDTKSLNSRLARISSYVSKYQAIRNSSKGSLSYDVRTIESNGILE